MISLKQNCTALNFKNMEKTKQNFELLMYGTFEKEIIDREIDKHKYNIKNNLDKFGQSKKQLEYLLKLKQNEYYKKDLLPRGIEKIILQAIESFAFWYSLNSSDNNFFLMQDNYIHNLINVSIVFMVSCEIAKLFNSKKEDFSLCNIWFDQKNEISNTGITDKTEIDYITEQFHRNEDTRDQSIKKFLDFRNKSIAHNSNTIGIEWSDIIKTINFIVRVWGILDEYISPNCFPRSIILEEYLYTPLQNYLKTDDIIKIKKLRLKIMKDIFKAASTNLITGVIDKIKPFGELKVTAKIIST